MNYFLNKNVMSFIKWIFIKTDDLDQVTFYFLSRQNATSPRYLPLLEETKKIRIVVLRGLTFPYTDILMIKLYWFLLGIFRNKCSNYRIIHTFNTHISYSCPIQVLHFDDPAYSSEESARLLKWEANIIANGFTPVIVCTNEYTSSWLTKIPLLSRIEIVEQGFNHIEKIPQYEFHGFNCAYTSQYIHYGADLHANHSAWGADTLIDSIIPKLQQTKKNLTVHIIGEVGKNAREYLEKYPNVILHGRVSYETNQAILSSCQLGLYPRKFDHRRSMSKIFSYIGASLPIVGFDLVDTEVVKKNSLGSLVKTEDEFVTAVVDLSVNMRKYSEIQQNVKIFSEGYTWKSLAAKLEKYLDVYFDKKANTTPNNSEVN